MNLDHKTGLRFIEAPNSRGNVIFLHGLSQGSSSEFFEQFAEEVVSNCSRSVFTFDFDFFRTKTEPSFHLQDEVKQVETAMVFVAERTGVKGVTLVGKSLGGIVALLTQARNAVESIERIFILGLPLVLGVPPRLKLLKGKETEPFDYQKEYKDIFERIKIPIHIIQGSNDDLGSVNVCQELAKDFTNITCDIVAHANHSFKDGTRELYADCFMCVLNRMIGKVVSKNKF